MYLCHLHRYADEDTPCDECESDFPERTGPSTNAFREQTYQDAVARMNAAMARLEQIPRGDVDLTPDEAERVMQELASWLNRDAV